MLTISSIGTISDRIVSAAASRQLFLVFDRDGTLVPFEADPADALFDPMVRGSLNRLSTKKKTRVALLSARSIRELRLDLPDGMQILGGNYGLEIETPEGIRFCHPKAESAGPSLAKVKALIEERLPAQFVPILEDHGLSLCLHWHMTPLSSQEQFHMIVSELNVEFPDLYFKRLETSYEVWPKLDWNKSHGLEKMMELENLDPGNAMILFAGDSIVDEEAMNWVNKVDGISILIGDRETQAQFRLDTPSQLHELIRQLDRAL